MAKQLAVSTIGEIVATDFRTASVFERFGIDFCCGGRCGLDESCRTAAVDRDDVVRALEALPPATIDGMDVTEWRLGRLIDHIVSTHHDYVRAATPTIRRYLAKLVEKHGDRHPELARVAACFDVLGTDLDRHMQKEEQMLFPYVRELAAAAGGRRRPGPFGTVANPIQAMEREHRDAADGLKIIRDLTHSYFVPDEGCTTYAVCMAELRRFERDLHRHVHLENNVLFPKAIALENGGQPG